MKQKRIKDSRRKKRSRDPADRLIEEIFVNVLSKERRAPFALVFFGRRYLVVAL